MSTKIYNGYILPPMSAFQLMELNNRLKVKMKATQEVLLKKKLGALCAEILQKYKDNPDYGNKLMSDYWLSDFEEHKDRPPYTPTPVYTLAAKIFNIKSKRIEKTMQRDPDFDLSFDNRMAAKKK